MNKQDIINTLAKELNWTKKRATLYVEDFFRVIVNKIKLGHKVNLKNVGSFQLTQKASRRILHPITKEEIILPEQTTIGFKPSTTTLKKLNKGLKE
ncbi:MAG: hypothetical protein CMP39_03795 [Rickettsiales bacterium]|nr:hypothetical protein [Rickettsiales bacterium]|tara:strand:- start:2309 stop:2596 length:288 start_codon:yes stop_codon:yes gene_type:complete